MVGPLNVNKVADVSAQDVERNVAKVLESLADITRQAGRTAGGVRLIAVSKTKPLALIQAAWQAGQKSFGENYVQEAVEKQKALPQADWHFIGTLQTNKAKSVIGPFSLIHSVDRLRLASALNNAAEYAHRVQDILLQIHVGDEATKHGFTISEAPAAIEAIRAMKHLRLRGLMSLPPLTEDEKIGRGYFASLREVLEQWRSAHFEADSGRDFDELSMGTSGDYEWAILEGATMVRIGTAIFGERADAARDRPTP